MLTHRNDMSFNQLIIKQSSQVKHRFTEDDFNLSRWYLQKDSTTLSGGRGGSQQIIIQGEAYVLRRYLRGGVIAHFLYDQYLWAGLTRSRPFLEQKAIEMALTYNLPVPEIIAYIIQKRGIIYRTAIISRFIKNISTLADFLSEYKMTDDNWRKLGQLISRLHQANIFHADLNANNILIDEEKNFHLIDFDKAKIIVPLGRLAHNNIKRLLRSLKKIQRLRIQQKLPFYFNIKQWQHLLNRYNSDQQTTFT